MKTKNTFKLIILTILLPFMGCQNNPIAKIQGVYKADKLSLKTMVNENLDSSNAFATALIDKAVENAIIEVQIKDDSISGLMFLAGETNLFKTNIKTEGDSLLISSNDLTFQILPNEGGIKLKNTKSDKGIQLLKTEQNTLSPETKTAIKNLAQKEKEEKEFQENLGKWQKGNFVDEFGDDTGKGYAYSILLGEHESSSIIKSEVYVKSTIEGESLYFQLFNKSMTTKVSFPDSKFGVAKLKFPNGDVKNEKIFFFKNTISESPSDKNNLIYNHIMNESGDLKILIDLSTASKYYSDRYQFTLSRSNLEEIQASLK